MPRRPTGAAVAQLNSALHTKLGCTSRARPTPQIQQSSSQKNNVLEECRLQAAEEPRWLQLRSQGLTNDGGLLLATKSAKVRLHETLQQS